MTPQDFEAYYLNTDATVEINLPNGEPMCYPPGTDNRVAVVVHSPATVQFVQAKADFDREATKRAMAAAGLKDKKFAENKFAEADFLAAITKEVINFPYEGGASAIYRNPRLRYIMDQVNTAANDMGNFFGAGTSN